MQRKITMPTILEALSRFNVTARANIKRDINGASWPIWYGSEMGIKNIVDRLRILVMAKCAVDAFYFTRRTCRISVESGARSHSHSSARHFPELPLQLFLRFAFLFSSFVPFFHFFFFLTNPEMRKYFTRTDTSTTHTRASAINDSANMFR